MSKADEEDKEPTTEEETKEESREEIAPAAEEQGRVIEIHAPPPFDEPALEPFIELYMQKRGLTNRTQAAVKLANSLAKIGFNPQRDIQNVTAYINNLQSVLDSIPDTPETEPIKGAIAGRGAVKMSRLLENSHFGGSDEFADMKEMMRFAQRARITMRMLDQAFSGETEHGKTEDPRVAALTQQVRTLTREIRQMRGQSALDAKLKPMETQLATLTNTVQAILTKPPKEENEQSALSKDVTQMLAAMNKRLDDMDQRYQYTTEMQGLRGDFNALKQEFLSKGGKGGIGEVEQVFDSATRLMDKINETNKKFGGGGDFDWRAATVSTIGEIATETISAAREIYAIKGEGQAEQPSMRTPQPAEKVSEQIVDRRLLSYIQKVVSEGATEFNSAQAANAIGITEPEVLQAYTRLQNKGILKKPAQGGEENDRGEKTGKPTERQWVKAA